MQVKKLSIVLQELFKLGRGDLHPASLNTAIANHEMTVVRKNCHLARVPEETVLLARLAKSPDEVTNLVEDLK